MYQLAKRLMSHDLDINSATYMQPVESPSDFREGKCLLLIYNLCGAGYDLLPVGERERTAFAALTVLCYARGRSR